MEPRHVEICAKDLEAQQFFLHHYDLLSRRLALRMKQPNLEDSILQKSRVVNQAITCPPRTMGWRKYSDADASPFRSLKNKGQDFLTELDNSSVGLLEG